LCHLRILDADDAAAESHGQKEWIDDGIGIESLGRRL